MGIAVVTEYRVFCLPDLLSRIYQSAAVHVFLCLGDPSPVPHHQVKDGSGGYLDIVW